MKRMQRGLHAQALSVVGRLLVAVFVITLVSAAFAADVPIVTSSASTVASEEIKKLPAVISTGSLLPTALQGGAPLDIVTSADIQKAGTTDMIGTLRKLNVSFSGTGNIGSELNNSSTYGETTIALRNLTTLVLLNGRRLGNSTFSNGGAVDVSTIPLAAVDRIEVLKDGASAIYGSEAVGGVVNIITRKDYTGVEITGRFGAATGAGDYFEQGSSIVSGFTTDKASFMAAASYYHNDPLLARDRPRTDLSLDELNALNLTEFGGYLSPTFPGETGQGDGSRWVLRGSTILQGLNPAEFNAAFQAPPIIPGFAVTNGGDNAIEQYNAAYLAANPLATQAPYTLAVQANGNPLYINTSREFGVEAYVQEDRNTFFGEGTYDLNGKMVQVYGTFLYANIDSLANLGPSPMISLAQAFGNLVIPTNSPTNPFGIALGPGGETADPRVRTRFIEFGNRLFFGQTDYYHFVGGLKGEFENGWAYDAGYTYNRYDQLARTVNAVNASALGLAVTPNSDTNLVGLSQLQDVSGAFVPIYNVFALPGQNDPATINAVKATLFQFGNSIDWGANGVITGHPFELKGGKVGVAVGGGYNDAFLAIDYDGLTKTAKAPGLNPALPTSGRRTSWAGFIEVRAPLTSPDMNVPGVHSLEVQAAGRYETFEPGGDSSVPKFVVRWQPIDEQVTLRGSYSQSFIAPSTFDLFGGDQQSANTLSVPTSDTVPTLISRQEASVFASNPMLTPVDAENWSFGVVVAPKAIKGLSVSVDYYHVRTANDIFNADGQTMVDSLNALGSASPFQPFYQRSDGSRLTTTAPNQVNDATWGLLRLPGLNGASQLTEGLDLTGAYEIPTDAMGTFTVYANANVLFKYDYSDPISGSFSYAGTYTDRFFGAAPGPQGMLPDYIINTGVTWDKPVGPDELSIGVNAKYVPEVNDFGGEFNTVDGSMWTIADYFKIDMQVGYEFGRNNSEARRWYDGTRISLGINNLTDEAFPLVASSTEDTTDKATYDIIGRFVYFQVAKKF